MYSPPRRRRVVELNALGQRVFITVWKHRKPEQNDREAFVKHHLSRVASVEVAKVKIQEKPQISFFFNPAKQMVPCENTAKDISFEWS